MHDTTIALDNWRKKIASMFKDVGMAWTHTSVPTLLTLAA